MSLIISDITTGAWRPRNTCEHVLNYCRDHTSNLETLGRSLNIETNKFVIGTRLLLFLLCVFFDFICFILLIGLEAMLCILQLMLLYNNGQ